MFSFLVIYILLSVLPPRPPSIAFLAFPHNGSSSTTASDTPPPKGTKNALGKRNRTKTRPTHPTMDYALNRQNCPPLPLSLFLRSTVCAVYNECHPSKISSPSPSLTSQSLASLSFSLPCLAVSRLLSVYSWFLSRLPLFTYTRTTRRRRELIDPPLLPSFRLPPLLFITSSGDSEKERTRDSAWQGTSTPTTPTTTIPYHPQTPLK